MIMGRTTLREEYFSWLLGLVANRKPGYRKLCLFLHEKIFRWSVYNDDNRCEDGRKLRERFIAETHQDESHLEVRYFLKGDCSVLEVLIALAIRMNDLMFDLDHQEDHTSKWFMEMLHNLGIDRFTDTISPYDRLDPVSEAKVDDILEIFMDRMYESDGRGGLFPLRRRVHKDQTKVEIWYQLMSWLDENYGD